MAPEDQIGHELRVTIRGNHLGRFPQGMRDKQFILSEIRRTATHNGGEPVGARRFETETGIAEHEWRGNHWARWGDALSEAGFAPLKWNTGSTVDEILDVLARLVRELGKYPTVSEILIAKRRDQTIPTPKALGRKLGPKARAIANLYAYCSTRAEFADVAAILAKDSTLDCPMFCADGRVSVAQLLKGPVFLYQGQS
jgi:hypothetical protein